ncbi:hypothetical protein I549_5991 [Mycobacterium avium subsp. avium 2285 (R)]|nr:hypothetical protein I549_5991 [Mycobacterium avium subsp. avium 2285 (R)]
MTDDQPAVPDVDRLARSMLLLHGDHHDHDERPAASPANGGSWSKSRDFTDDPQRAAAVAEASRADRERYLNSGLLPVDCRFCHARVAVRRLGPGHTAVQWNTEAWQRCAYFTEVRQAGATPRAPSPARSSATASSMPSPRDIWTTDCAGDHSPANRSLTVSTLRP